MKGRTNFILDVYSVKVLERRGINKHDLITQSRKSFFFRYPIINQSRLVNFIALHQKILSITSWHLVNKNVLTTVVLRLRECKQNSSWSVRPEVKRSWFPWHIVIGYGLRYTCSYHKCDRFWEKSNYSKSLTVNLSSEEEMVYCPEISQTSADTFYRLFFALWIFSRASRQN